MKIVDLKNYLENIYKKTKDEMLVEETVRRRIIFLLNKASVITNLSTSDLLSRLVKSNDQTIEALESFLAELRSIVWLDDFGITKIVPLQAGKNRQPDFTAEYSGQKCAVEVFCLTQAHEQQKNSTLNVYVNFDPNCNGSKFGRDFMSKAAQKKAQLDSIDAKIKILLCVINSQPVICLNTKDEIHSHAKLLYDKLQWGQGYHIGLLTGVKVNGKASNTIYPNLSE